MEDTIVLQVGIKILLKNKEGKYLLVRRSLEKYPEVTGRWDIVGGRIKPGTPLLENLQREVKEETGLEITGNPTLIAAQDIFKNNRHIVRLSYVGDSFGDVQLDQSENDMYEWYTWDELIAKDDLDVYFQELVRNNNSEFSRK
jgi:ADP-ribose pyrophosphatase YjhB (NUDIX family)